MPFQGGVPFDPQQRGQLELLQALAGQFARQAQQPQGLGTMVGGRFIPNIGGQITSGLAGMASPLLAAMLVNRQADYQQQRGQSIEAGRRQFMDLFRKDPQEAVLWAASQGEPALQALAETAKPGVFYRPPAGTQTGPRTLVTSPMQTVVRTTPEGKVEELYTNRNKIMTAGPEQDIYSFESGEPQAVVGGLGAPQIPAMGGMAAPQTPATGGMTNIRPRSETWGPSQKGREEAATFKIKRLGENLNAQQQSVKAYLDAQQMGDLLKDPTITGLAADPKLFIARIGEAFGFTGDEAITNTQTLLRSMARQTLNSVRMLPGAISEKELPFLQEASAGKLSWTPRALYRLAKDAQATAFNTWKSAEEYKAAVGGDPGVAEEIHAYPTPQFPMDAMFQSGEFKEIAGKVVPDYEAIDKALPQQTPAAAPQQGGVLKWDALTPEQRENVLKHLQGGR